MTARPTLRLGLFAIVAFVLGLVLARLLLGTGPSAVPQTANATVFTQQRALSPLELVDHELQPVSAATLEGRWTWVFFGFTHCPDVCPTTLAMLAQARRQLADLPAGRQPHVLMISVDPERDTPARLKEYVRFFDPTFAAATGTPAQVERAASAFAVPYAKVPLPQGGYTMDHGAGVFFVAPTGKVIAYSSPPLRSEVLAQDFRLVQAYFEETH